MSSLPSILVLNGPNLNMLGVRDPDLYGRDSLQDIQENCTGRAGELGLAAVFRQSNAEGELVSWIQQARGQHAGIVINAGGFSHSSIAILDALQLTELPVIEVHLSNIFKREAYRRHSYVSEVARGVICGFGGLGYWLALEAMAALLQTKKFA